jgi:hypothetical protein
LRAYSAPVLEASSLAVILVRAASLPSPYMVIGARRRDVDQLAVDARLEQHVQAFGRRRCAVGDRPVDGFLRC